MWGIHGALALSCRCCAAGGVGIEAGEEVGAVHATQGRLDGMAVLGVVPEEILALGEFFFFAASGEHGL